jgi:hypothetical protein
MPSSLLINLRERVVETLTGRRDLPWLRRPLRSQRVACQPLGEARAGGGTDRIVGAAQRSALAGHRGPSRSDPSNLRSASCDLSGRTARCPGRAGRGNQHRRAGSNLRQARHHP